MRRIFLIYEWLQVEMDESCKVKDAKQAQMKAAQHIQSYAQGSTAFLNQPWRFGK